MEKPNYYAILPAEVRYSKELSPMERLLYAEITCLCNHKGYCWATNNYFGGLFDRHGNTISKCINNLFRLGFIDIKLIKNDKNVIESRIIKLVNEGVSKNINPPKQKRLDPISENATYNNKIINNNKEELFNQFWEIYGKKIGLKACKTKFMKLNEETCIKCVSSAKSYITNTTDTKYRKNPLTWLNQGCWDDEYENKSNGYFTGEGFENMVF
jgi:hypothetical protein|tara:strand:- start:963 stop:1601 length:639 start_codon:yes stop_codon:yes gene_type:complete